MRKLGVFFTAACFGLQANCFAVTAEDQSEWEQQAKRDASKLEDQKAEDLRQEQQRASDRAYQQKLDDARWEQKLQDRRDDDRRWQRQQDEKRRDR